MDVSGLFFQFSSVPPMRAHDFTVFMRLSCLFSAPAPWHLCTQRLVPSILEELSSCKGACIVLQPEWVPCSHAANSNFSIFPLRHVPNESLHLPHLDNQRAVERKGWLQNVQPGSDAAVAPCRLRELGRLLSLHPREFVYLWNAGIK